jgi:hypothetical protein
VGLARSSEYLLLRAETAYRAFNYLPMFTVWSKTGLKCNPHLYHCRTPKTPNVRIADNYGLRSIPGISLASQSAMFAILCILGGLWLLGAALFVFALASAGRRPMPSSEGDTVVLKRAA